MSHYERSLELDPRSAYLAHDLAVSYMWLREFPKAERIFLIFFIPVGASTFFAELTVAFGHFTEYAPFLYEVVLLFFLSVGVFSFFSLLLGPRE